MANWARGLAAGLETGYRLGEMYQKGAERRALQEAATATPEQLQGYTSEQGAQLEAAAKSGLYDIGMKTDEAGNFQGYTVTPKASPEMQGLVAPGQVTEMYGQRYEGTLSPERVRGLRMGRMADVLAETDPVRAEQLRAAQAEQEYLAQARPMQLESAGLELRGKRADAEDRQRMVDFQAWMQEDPTRGQNFQAVAAKARELGMSIDQQFKVASNLTGIDEAEFKAGQARIRKLTQGQGLDGLLKLHKDSNDLDPGSHFEKTVGKDGRITLNRVDTATGQIIQPNVFSGKEDEVVGYLNKAAMDPATIVDYTMTLQKNKAAIAAQEAATEASRATTALRGAQLTGLQNQRAGSEEAARIREQYMELTPEEQAGAKGQGLIRQFNMANAKAGNMVPMGTPPKTERTQLSPGEVTNRAKAMVDARERNPDTNKPYTLTEAVRFIEGGAVTAADALIDAMRRNAPAAKPAAPGRATPAGQQILGLADVMLPPTPAAAPGAPTTSRDRMRGLYLGQ